MDKRVCIVFEESGEHGGKGFNVYLEGLSLEATTMTSQEQIDKLSPADFWGLRMFQICIELMKKAGVVYEERRRS